MNQENGGEITETPRNDAPNFVVSVHDRNRGWTDNRPLHRRADSVRVNVGGYSVYVFLHNADPFKPIGVRVLHETAIVSTFVAGGCCAPHLHNDEAESHLNSLHDYDESEEDNG